MMSAETLFAMIFAFSGWSAPGTGQTTNSAAASF
jgi:hypothetical protein